MVQVHHPSSLYVPKTISSPTGDNALRVASAAGWGRYVSFVSSVQPWASTRTPVKSLILSGSDGDPVRGRPLRYAQNPCTLSERCTAWGTHRALCRHVRSIHSRTLTASCREKGLGARHPKRAL